jgi:DNA-binding beta-propeller fold protein YncE
VTRRELLVGGLAAAMLDPRACGRGVAARHPLALVTADTEAHVVVISLATGALRGRVATLEGPRSIERAPGGAAVVGHPSEGAVTLLEGRPVRVRRVLRGFREPRYTAVHGALAYVTDSGLGELAVVDLARGRVVRRVEVGAGARHVSLAPDGRTLWISLGSSAALVAVVDLSRPTRPRVAGHVRPPFLAHDVGFSGDGRRVWVTAGRERRLAVYRPGGRLVGVLAADEAPQHVSVSRGLAFVTSGDGGSAQVRSVGDGALRRTTAIPRGSYNVQAAGGRVVTPSLMHGTLTVLDGAGRVVVERRVAAAAHDACVVA